MEIVNDPENPGTFAWMHSTRYSDNINHPTMEYIT